MTTITVKARNKKELAKIKIALKLIDADFYENQEDKTITNPELLKRIEEVKNGTAKLIQYTPEIKKELFNEFL